MTMTTYPHVQASFINVIREEGTKSEACDWLQKQWDETCAVRKELADALDLLAKRDAELARKTAALTEIAKQKRTNELDTEYEAECADFEGGYDACIDRARAALTPEPTEYERKVAQMKEDFPNGI
jgi:hypothetical protein